MPEIIYASEMSANIAGRHGVWSEYIPGDGHLTAYILKSKHTAEIERYRRALEKCFAVLIAQDFKPDAGSPPILKDGVKDAAIAAAREALNDKGVG